MTTISLNGTWELRNPVNGEVYPAVVPGVVHTDLMAAGVIDRPYYRENERKYAWIGEQNWVYRRSFQVDPELLNSRTLRMTFAGLDTFAAVRLNGVLLGETDNMFRRFFFDVSSVLRAGANDLEVAFESPLARATALAETVPMKIPYTGEVEWNITHTHRNLIRKCQCHAGWDWGPAFLTSGIWRDVTLEAFNHLRIEAVKPVQLHHGEQVQVQTWVYLDVATEGIYHLSVSIAGQRKTQPILLSAGQQEVRVDLDLVNPRLWWPHGFGEQYLHSLDVMISHDNERVAEYTLRTGLRHIELVQKDDDHGRSFYFKVNGRPIFLKGYNWIPVDCFTSRMTRETYADLIGSAAAAHCNLLRVWGGGIYEQDDFYELCDEQGILVWQDFMFACAMYPWDDSFLANVSQEVREQIRRLARHPSLVLWCGNNECEMAVDWYPESRNNRQYFLEGYHKLFIETIGPIVQAEVPDLPYWPSSPSNGPGVYGDSNATDRGDTHYWEVWHGGKPFSEYLTVKPRMSSEYGFQSVPSIETLQPVMEADDLNISSPMMDFRQRSAIGNRAMVEHMMGDYFLPKTFDQFVYLSQVQQGMAMKIATEHWRRLMPVNMGTVIWQLNDIWPGNSWSSIEYGGKWKALHSFSQRFFAPILLSIAKTADGIEVWTTNDGPGIAQGDFVLEARDFDGHIIRRWEGSYVEASGGSSLRLTVPYDQIAPKDLLHTVFLYLQRNGEDDSLSNWTLLRPAKYCPLRRPTLQLTVVGNDVQTEISLQTDLPTFHVWLDIPGRRGTFSDNAFLLLPDRPKRIRYKSKDNAGPILPEMIRITHLRETY